MKPASLVGWLAVAAGLATLVGCSGAEPVAPYHDLITDPTQVYMRLTIDYRALTLSTDPSCHCATWQLTATPRDALDSAMTDLPAPTFRPLSESDTVTVRVTADGLVRARQEGTTKILAELTVGNVRHADTAFIVVKNPVPLPTLASVSLDPLLPDSAIRPLSYIITTEFNDLGLAVNQSLLFYSGILTFSTLTPRALNTLGESVTELPFDFEALDPDTATVQPAEDRRTATWDQVSPGRARFVVRTTAYGVTVVDTAVFTVTLPVLADVLAQPKPGAPATMVFEPHEVHIRPSGMVFWSNRWDHPIEVTFDDPTHVVEAPTVCTLMDLLVVRFLYAPTPPHCATGNFTLAPPPLTTDTYPYPVLSTAIVRQFPEAGVYPYHDASTGAIGRVVVE